MSEHPTHRRNHQQRASLAIAALLAAVSPAHAAEPERWSGFYGGLHIGYGAGRDDVDEVNGPRAYFPDTRGVLGGVQLGWQKQIDRLVLGVEAELGHLGQSESRGDVGGTVSTSIDLGPYATFSGRIGYVPAPDWIITARAGVAVAALDATTTQTGATPSTASTRDTTWGGVFGAGVERALGARWSLRGEYQYLVFVRELALPDNGGPGPGWNHNIDLHIVKIALNYRF